MRKGVFMCAVSVLLFLAGCGSSGNSEKQESSKISSVHKSIGGIGDTISVERMVAKKNKQDRQDYQALAFKVEQGKGATKTYQGKLFNGYIEKSRVCLDYNNNNLCDYYEPLGTPNRSGVFELKVPVGNDKIGEMNKQHLDDASKQIRVLASRGTDVNTARMFMAFLKAPLPAKESEQIELSPIKTLVLTKLDDINDKDTFDTSLNENIQKAKTLFNGEIEKYKENLIFQKTAQLLSMTLDPKDQKQTLEKLKDTYKSIDLDASNYEQALTNLQDVKLKTAVTEAKNMATAIKSVDLNNSTERESLAVLLDAKVNEAKVFFRNSDNVDFKSEIEITGNLQDQAIKVRLKEIGLAGSKITADMINAVKNNNLKLEDLDKLDKVDGVSGLEKLAELLKKKQNATSELFVLKAFINKTQTELKVFFSHKISQESKTLLSSVDEVKKVYTMEGLTYTSISSTRYEEGENVNIITFSSPVELKQNPTIVINELTLSDADDIYARALADPTAIETVRTLPVTGQEMVFMEGDDGSYQYGEQMNYVKVGEVVRSPIANLEWEDGAFISGTNDDVTIGEAKKYCSSLTLNGHEDWRLPNVKEAVSATSLDPTTADIFTNYPQTEVIHVDSENASLGKTMGVRKNGRVTSLIDTQDDFWGYKPGRYGVRCVRDIESGSLYPHKAKDNIIMFQKDQTSYDPTLRIMFQDEPYTQAEQDAVYKRDENGKGLSHGKFGDFEHAINYCKSLNEGEFAGYKNWRLPNANELFYSLNASGHGTYQNRIPTYGYYITSSSTYMDGTRVSWFTGNFYNRKFLYNRTRGYIRCIRSMDEDELKTPRSVNAPADKKIKRKFTVGANNEVNVTAPASIFSKYKGIRLTQVRDVNLTDIDYEITNMLHKDYVFPHYVIKSIKKNGKVVPLDEKGYFRIYLEMALTGDSYGKRKFKTGDVLEIIINNRIYDVKINLTIGIQEGENDSGDIDPQEVKEAPVLKLPATNPIKISQAAGTRMPGGNGNVLSFATSERAHANLPEDSQYYIVENPGDPYVKKLDIVSGNEDGIFEVYEGFERVGIRVKKEKIKTLTPKTYELGLKANNGKDSNVVVVKVKIVPQEAPVLKQNVILDIEKDAQKEASYAKRTSDGRLVLFIFSKLPSVLDGVINIIEDDKGLSGDENYEYSGSSENYEVAQFSTGYSTGYGIVVKSGKAQVNEDLTINVKATTANGQVYTLSTTVKLMGGDGSIVDIEAPKFHYSAYKKVVKSNLKVGDRIGEYEFTQELDMDSFSSDTVFTVEPSGIFEIEPKASGGAIYVVVKDPSKLTNDVFDEDGHKKTFTLTATNTKGSDSATLEVELHTLAIPVLKSLTDPIEIFQASGYRTDGTTNIFTYNDKFEKRGDLAIDSPYNIVEDAGTPVISNIMIVEGNEDGIFELDSTLGVILLKVPSNKVSMLEAKTYTLKLQAQNSIGKSNIIELKVKVLAPQKPILKGDMTSSLTDRPFPYTRKSIDDRPFYWDLSAGTEPSTSYPERFNLIEDMSGFTYAQISYELVSSSDVWEIVSVESFGTTYWGIVVKNGQTATPETLTIKVIGTANNGQITSDTMELTITN